MKEFESCMHAWSAARVYYIFIRYVLRHPVLTTKISKGTVGIQSNKLEKYTS